MKNKKCLPRIIIFIFVLLLVAFPLFSYDIAKENVNSNMLLMVIYEKFGENAFFDDENDLITEYDGIYFLIQIDSDRAFLKFSSQWKALESISMSDAYEIVNAWNSETVFSTVFFWNGRFRLEYFMSFEGGLNSENFNDTLHWLYSIASAFDDVLKKKGVI